MTTIFALVQFDIGLKIIDFKQLMMQYYGPFVFFLCPLGHGRTLFSARFC